MGIVAYNSFKIRSYLQNNYFDGEYMTGREQYKAFKIYKDDINVQHYKHNLKYFFYLLGGVMMSMPFLLFLTTINWDLN